ncbi:futalosine hydrolase [Dactylosporangium sp. AC04546]|uniref:futalosine hydrolase n=1 Tax=Dactylosporangium sp. AC04546 TaxID=2862460 RepID=UPI001EE12FC4|nr:futalosine hydrolase [Dactylosporangium sp. AC04546]WVK83448.1 futalosine hydrolase [Dactylosporangium sp. AC04546]
MRDVLGYGRTLVITAVEAERSAVLAGLGLEAQPADALEAGAPVVVAAAGVGPAAAAAVTTQFLTTAVHTGAPFGLVLSAGIAGGFAGRVEIGGLVVATESIAADLGAAGPEGYQSVEELGFGTARHDADPAVLRALRVAFPEAVGGPVLTVSTVTGTAAAKETIEKRHPDAVAEAMEGFGVATAARLWPSTAFGELRTISNAVGPRDRAAWRIPQALETLRDAFATLSGR